ncbi:hypothetical protein [Arthrobacter sp. NPDC090010]|uniref:hypothetical protein n=1 Tax=Arthrobacter sp. NPDC090010 TaxID=3363942 RepID=UPI0038046C85
MSTTGITGMPAAIADYAAAVRRELGDLPKHDVDELTEGLDADLLEQFRESGTPPLESPAAYAAELRTSAGFGPRTASRSGAARGLTAAYREAVTKLRLAADRYPLLRAAWDFLVLLRPLWWVVRAWTVYQIFASAWGSGVPRFVFPHGPLTWAFFILCVVLSVSWSTRVLRPGQWPARLRTITNVVTVAASLVMVPLAIAVANSTEAYTGYTPPGGPCTVYDGVCHNGSVVGPLFVYGPDGSRLENVRFFSYDGSTVPVDLAPAEDPGPWTVAPRSTSGASTPDMSPAPSPTTPGSAVPGNGTTSAPISPAPSSSVTPAPKASATAGR